MSCIYACVKSHHSAAAAAGVGGHNNEHFHSRYLEFDTFHLWHCAAVVAARAALLHVRRRVPARNALSCSHRRPNGPPAAFAVTVAVALVAESISPPFFARVVIARTRLNSSAELKVRASPNSEIIL